MAIRDIDLTNRQTHIFVSGSEALFPRNDLFPADDLFPVDSGIYLSHNIVAGSMKLDEIIVDGDTIVFGNLYSTKFEVQIFGSVEVGTTIVDIDQIDFHGKFIFVYQEDNGVFKRLFTGVVDSAKKNRDGLDKTLIAYDSAYALRNVNVADWWAAYWSSTALMYNQGNLDMAVAFYSDASSGVETYLNSIYPASTYNTRYALNLYNGKVYLAGTSAWAYNQTLSAGIGNKVKLIDKTSGTPATVYKTPLGTLRESVLSYLGIDYEDVLLTNDYLCVAQDVEVSLLTFGTLMRMICELNCCFPHFGRDNRMVFIVLDVEGTAKNINGLYDGSGSTFEEFVTEPITGIQFLNSDGDVKYVVGQDTNVYTPAKDNIFLLTFGTDDLKLAGNNMLAYVSDLSYCPFEVEMVVGDLQYEVGDLITTSLGTHFIFKNSFSGAQFVNEIMTCTGTESINEVSQPVDTSVIVLNERIAKVVYDVEHFETEFAEYRTQTDGTLTSLSSRITQNTSAITAEVTRASTAEGNLSSSIQITANAISAEVTRATGAEGTLSSSITQNANAITAEVTRATGAEGTLSSSISQQADEIALKLNASDYTHAKIVAKINDSTSSVQIAADKIDLSGYATFTNLSTSGQSTINGANITTGNLTLGTSSGSKIVIDRSGYIYGYNNNNLKSEIYIQSDGISIGSHGASVFDSYIHVFANNVLEFGAYTLKINGTTCDSGTFTDKNGKVITVTKGLITDIGV